MCISELTEVELAKAPSKVKEYFREISAINTERISITNDAYVLARSYIAENVVGKTSFADCLHIAVATINKVDILVSWNFKHIVNVYRIRGYNSVNLKQGHGTLEIRSPKDIVGNESED